ncbi:MAG: pilus assembly protein N-terminal domain-containing protein, partial [Burkholderiaceae bacterium]
MIFLSKLLLWLVLSFASLQVYASQAVESRQKYQLLVGDSVVVSTSGMYRVSVGNARAIQAVPVDPSELLLIGEAAGFSRVHVWEKGRVRSIEVTVLANHLERVLEEAKAALAPN